MMLELIFKYSMTRLPSPSIYSTLVRHFSVSPVFSRSQAGKYHPSKFHDKPLTYEQANPPHQIKHRKGWNTWNTSNLMEGLRSSETAVEDFFIRKFMIGTWHRIFISDIIIKRRHNMIIISGIILQSLQVRKLYFLIGYTEEILSFLFKCPFKLELQTVSDRKDVVYKYI